MSNHEGTIKEIFEIQLQFSKRWFEEKKNLDVMNLPHDERMKWSKEYILAAINELCEALNELKWKTHREFEKTDNIDNFIEECIDVFKFLLNIVIINGCDEKMFYEKFIDKSYIVELRYKQESSLAKLRNDKEAKIVVVDIDGVLNDYPVHFLRYAKDSGYTYKSVPDFKETNITAYNQIKHHYRTLGHEKYNTEIEGAKEFLDQCKEKGYTVVLLSARPYEKIKRIYKDTVDWLKNHNMKYDLLVFNKKKDTYIIENLKGCDVIFCVDDDFNNSQNLSYHFKTYLMRNEGLFDKQSYSHIPKNVTLINSLSEIYKKS